MVCLCKRPDRVDSSCTNVVVETDFAWLKFAPKDPAKLQAKKDSELLNGRLAMCAVGGIATQSILSGHGFPYV